MNITQFLDDNRRKVLTGAGAIAAAGATLLATSLPGSAEPPAERGTRRRANAHASRAVLESDRAPLAGATLSREARAWKTAAPLNRTMVEDEAGAVLTRASSTANPANPHRGSLENDQASDVSVPPRKITLTLPQYHPGTPPTVTPPSVSGSQPKVQQDDGSITITIPNDGEVIPPSVTPGESGRLDAPSVTIE